MRNPTVTEKSARHRAYTTCRTLGHAWDVQTEGRDEAGDLVMRIRCDHCSAQRIDIISKNTGDLFSRRYHQPASYKNVEKLSRAEWRLKFLAGVLAEEK